jgi:hypothetical protein
MLSHACFYLWHSLRVQPNDNSKENGKVSANGHLQGTDERERSQG